MLVSQKFKITLDEIKHHDEKYLEYLKTKYAADFGVFICNIFPFEIDRLVSSGVVDLTDEEQQRKRQLDIPDLQMDEYKVDLFILRRHEWTSFKKEILAAAKYHPKVQALILGVEFPPKI